jgi:hypothetical protein
MERATQLRVGALAAIVGGVGGLVGNVLHPRPPMETDLLLQIVASMPHWTAIHLMIAVSTVFMVGAFALCMPTLEGDLARAIGTLSTWAAALGGTVLIAGIMIDGYGYPYMAEAWLGAGGEEKVAILWAADAMHVIDLALYTAWVTVFLGLGFLLAGAALILSRNYSRWLGGMALLGGAMCLLQGVTFALRHDSPIPVWPLAAAVDAVWLVMVGVTMARKSRPRPARSSSPR